MTTRKFSAISLPHPKCSFEIGCFDLKKREEINLSTWLPRFSDLAQVIEVKKVSALTAGFNSNKIINPYTVIDNARPELFLRRDFISKFVGLGTVHLVQLDSPCLNKDLSYQLFTSDNNILSIILNERQYKRFGMIAKKVTMGGIGGSKRYRIDIDLGEEKIKTCNKYQDRLVLILRRLNSINKLYFRFVPGKQLRLTALEANEYSIKFLRYVMDEYALDGFKPVPLTGCSGVSQRVERSWTNHSQLHPCLDLVDKLQNDSSENIQRNVETLAGLVNIIDWLGYQLLTIDCDREEIQSRYPSEEDKQNEDKRLDVSCTQISGLLDVQQIQENLSEIFSGSSGISSSTTNKNTYNKRLKADNVVNYDNNTVFRALNLYKRGQEGTEGVILLQDCSQEERSHLITVACMSSCTW